jgi:hypothetical protein
VDEYQELVGHHSEHDGWFSSHSTTTEKFYGEYYEMDRSMSLEYKKLIWHSVSMFPGGATANDDFNLAVAVLPTEYDAAAYQEFINTYGTHYMSKAYMGGLALMTQYFTSCFLQQYGGQYVYHQSSSSFFGIFDHKSGDKHGFNKTDGQYVQYSSTNVTLFGGFADQYSPFNWTNQVGEATLQKWTDDIKFDMMPVSYEMQPLYTLISDPVKMANVNRSLWEYGANITAQNIALVNKLKPKDPHKVPSWCKFDPHPPLSSPHSTAPVHPAMDSTPVGSTPLPSCPSLPSQAELLSHQARRTPAAGQKAARAE